MLIPCFDLSRQYRKIKKEIDKAMRDVFETSNFILGKEVELFEKKFANYVGTKHAIGVGNGTDALTLSLVACGIKGGDEVIVPSFTASPTVLAVSDAGANPVFVDIEPETYCMDPSLIKKQITKKTKAIIPVHLYGHPADMKPIMEIAVKYGIDVIEDACQAHGSEYRGRKAGSLGRVGCFSFYPTKNLGCFGDGGMVVTRDDELAERVRMLRCMGQKGRVYHSLIKGYNSRLDELQAAVLNVKLKYVDAWNAARRKNAKTYGKLLGETVVTPSEGKYAKHIYHLYVIRTQRRDWLRDVLARNSITTSIHYPIPVHLQKAYLGCCKGRGSLPITEKYADKIITLPMFPEMKTDEIERVAGIITDAMKK